MIIGITLFAALSLPHSTLVYDRVATETYRADLAADVAWSACNTYEKLVNRQAKVRAALVESFGGFPARCPLNAQITGTYGFDGYRVEKVMFESRPGHHVTATLFLPDPEKFPGKRPGIIVPCGHSANGKGCLAYQRGALKAAKLGMVAMVYDPIDQGERHQSRGNAHLTNCAAHNQIGARAELLGWNTLSFRLWDGMRSLDYLETRDEVDAERLGVMGHSGGGTMTSWLMCLDGRIKCAAPSGYLTTFRDCSEHIGPQDAEQNVFGEFRFGMNHLGHLMLRAPSPVLLCSSHADFFPITGTLETAMRAKMVFAALGKPDNFRLSDTFGFHQWHESTSSFAADWMNHWLQNAPLERSMDDYRDLEYGFDITKSDTALGYEPKDFAEVRTGKWEVSVTPTGNVIDLPDERTVYDLMDEEAARQFAERTALTPQKVRQLAGIRETTNIESRVVNGIVQSDNSLPIVYVTRQEDRLIVDTEKMVEVAQGKHQFYSAKNSDEEVARLYYVLGMNLVAQRAEEIIAAAKALGNGAPLKLVASGRGAIPAAHAYYTARELFSSIEIANAPHAWADCFADDALTLAFADVVHGAWRLYDWTDLVK